MSFYDDDDDDASGSDRNPLRKVVKDLEKKLAAEEKARKEAEAQLQTIGKTVKQRTVSDVLKDKGVNPALARFVLQDLDDPTPESVDQWVKDNGELFGVKAAEPEGEDPAQALGLQPGTTLPPDLVEQIQKFQASQSGGQSSTASVSLEAKLADPNLSHEELLNLISTAQ